MPEKSTRLVEIVYTSSSPEFAALAATTIAEEYTQQNLDLRLETINKNLVWLGDEVVKQEKKVTEAETAMAQLPRAAECALARGSPEHRRLAAEHAQRHGDTRANGTRLQKEAAYSQVKSVDPKSDAADAFPVICDQSRRDGSQDAAERLDGRQSAALVAIPARTSGSHQGRGPDRKRAGSADRAARARDRIGPERVRSGRNRGAELCRRSSSRRRVRRWISTARAAATSCCSVRPRRNRLVYQSLLQQQKELRVISNSRTNNVTVMDRAEVPGAPFSPNARRDWFTALLAGLLVAARPGVWHRVPRRHGEDARRCDRKAVDCRCSASCRRCGTSVSPLLSEPVPHDFGEAFRSLRTSLVFTSGAEGRGSSAVTSSQPLEGKTTTACNLGMVLALGGSRVLLVDADMRRPGLHTVIGAKNEIGLSHLLVGQARVRDAVQKTSEPNLFVITAGLIPPNPSELLSSERMNALLENLRSGPFDWVIIDTPPGTGGHRRRHRRARGVRRRLRDWFGDDSARARRASD